MKVNSKMTRSTDDAVRRIDGVRISEQLVHQMITSMSNTQMRNSSLIIFHFSSPINFHPSE
jgi:hypothetical protein